MVEIELSNQELQFYLFELTQSGEQSIPFVRAACNLINKIIK